MAAICQHKCASLAVELRGLVASLPRRDVIGRARDDVAVDVEAPHVERRAAHLQLSRIDIRIGADEIEKIGMQLCAGRRVVSLFQ